MITNKKNSCLAAKVRKLRRNRDLLEVYIFEAMEAGDQGAADYMRNDIHKIDAKLDAILA